MPQVAHVVVAEPDLEAAVRRAAAGDAAAFGELVEALQRPLYAVLVRYVREADEAMDLVQQAFLRALEQLPKLDRPASFRPWLFRIGVNLALQQLRRERRHPMAELDDERDASPTESADVLLQVDEQRRSLEAALDLLSPTQRAVLLLRVEAELPYEEVARAVGTSENAARVHFHNAVKRLRERVGTEE